MDYLIMDTDVSRDFCIKCSCKNVDCKSDRCESNQCFMDRESVCPSHCWAQVCITAKVDPFGVTI